MAKRTSTSRGTSARSPRRPVRGRAIVALGLLAFVSVAAAIVWRRTLGIAHAREIRVLDARRVHLEGERAALQSAVRRAASRGSIVDEVTSLGMRVPSDTQVVILTRPTVGTPDQPAAGDSTP